MSRHLQGKGLFHSGNLSTVLLPELHITPFEKKQQLKIDLPNDPAILLLGIYPEKAEVLM